ncbi:Serine/threonine-protein kinase PknD [Planctomycetes bacterium LzC2]|uniref:Serine/threonine-protein kinase PknD n=1 Tax=Alienimonas chondri TaxID=2681879 RepID=A0ABX1VHZ7_9PLAN|nr:Serine/threonine-protein kinase PknD [Alienimonas chondri]
MIVRRPPRDSVPGGAGETTDDHDATASLPDVAALFDGLDAPPDVGGFDGLLPDPSGAPDDRSGSETSPSDSSTADTLPLGGASRESRTAIFEPGDLPPGTELEHFRIEAPIGHGGMGAVYRALDLSLERYVAVKVIRPDRHGHAAAPGSDLVAASGLHVRGSARKGVRVEDVRSDDFLNQTDPDPHAATALPPSGNRSGNRSGNGTGSGSVALDRLLQEARAQARVNHPNVAHVYFVSPDPDKPFLAMELVDGPTLADKLKAGRLPYGAVTRIGGQIAGALDCAAKYDIVHGDVKPSNVLLAGARGDRPGWIGTVKLSDFGLARRTNLARIGGLEGTPNYLAPEIVRGGSPTARSDLYALGVTLFEMTFGRLPYTTPRQSLKQRLHAHLNNAPEFPEPWPADLPPGWRDVLARLLAKNPEDRPADAAEAAREIRRLAPQSNTPAGLLIRSMAALTDLGLATAAGTALFAVIYLPGVVEVDRSVAGLRAMLPLALFAKAAACVPALLLAWRQARTKRTPGKRLFQIRVADRYGLPPAGRTLLVRGLAQTFPIWGLVLALLAEHLTGQLWLEQSLTLFVLTLWTIDAAFGLFTGLFKSEARALHDRLLGTHVVLDTAAGPAPGAE